MLADTRRIGDDQWNRDITGILTSNANNAIAELGFNPNVLRALKTADSDITKLNTEKRVLENRCRDLSAHLALANNRIDFSKQDVHAMWKEVIYYREKYHSLQRQHQETLQAHSACATGPPEQSYIHLLQELEKLQDMYRHILGQNTTLKFEVQRLMQQCVNAGLIPVPQSYGVTPLPALQPVRNTLCRSTVLNSHRIYVACTTTCPCKTGLRTCSCWPTTTNTSLSPVHSGTFPCSLSPSFDIDTYSREHNQDRLHGSLFRLRRTRMHRLFLPLIIQRLLRGQSRHTTTIATSSLSLNK